MPNNQLYTNLLERVMVERPELAPYAELFQQWADNNNETSESEGRIKELGARLRKMMFINKQLKEDLDDALDELDDFAKAVGACPRCWGEDNRCPVCHGKGYPGSFKIDMKLFEEIIMPALRQIP